MDLKNTGNAASVEIVKCIEKAGITPGDTNLEQLGEAVAKIARTEASTLSGFDLRFDRDTLWPGRYMGKQIYARLVKFPSLPNATSGDVAHGIQDIDWITVSHDYSCLDNGNFVYPICFPAPGANTTAEWNCKVSKEVIRMTTGTDRRSDSAVVCLLFTRLGDPVID